MVQLDPNLIFCANPTKRKAVFKIEKVEVKDKQGDLSTVVDYLSNSGVAPNLIPCCNSSEIVTKNIVETAKLEQITNVNKAGKLSPTERKAKIQKYLEKKNKRKWNKRLEYDCRRQVAETRRRVQGRFAGKGTSEEPKPSLRNTKLNNIQKVNDSPIPDPNANAKISLSMTDTQTVISHPVFQYIRTGESQSQK